MFSSESCGKQRNGVEEQVLGPVLQLLDPGTGQASLFPKDRVSLCDPDFP